MLLVKSGFIQLKFYTIKRFVFLFFFYHSMLNIPIIVCLIHVPAYAKLVILKTETLPKVIEQLLQ